MMTHRWRGVIGYRDKKSTYTLDFRHFLVSDLVSDLHSFAAFARVRHLRKSSTYLIINLTVADLLVGAVTGPLIMYHEESNGFTWSGFIFLATKRIFPIASQVNLSLISLERLHAALFPFRHCLITKWLYLKIIVGSWFVILLIAFVKPVLPQDALPYSWASFSAVTLLFQAVCSR